MIVATRVDPGTLRLSAWITDLTRGVTSRFTPETERVDWPTWSPDGKRIAYRVGPQVCIRDVAGSGMLESLPSEREGLHVWSPNGAMLAIGGTGLALVPLGGDHKPVVSIQGQFAQPAFSPDGHWIAYASAESGSFEVFVQSFPVGHGKWQISPDGGGQPVWRRDGKELFYISAGHRIVAVPVKIGVTFEAGTPKELFSANNSALFYFRRQYSVSPDGQRFLVNLHVEDHPKTILLQNWLSQAR
jgi:dipeptidyl aminopeptidase/acylaminoacyl peptidase